MKIPQIGFGTFRLEGDIAYQSVSLALKNGYQHIDTAQIYGNETEVGQAIADSGIAREELYITTKVWNDKLSSDSFIASVKESLKKLKTDYVDLLLIHWPAFPNGVSLEQAVQNLYEAKKLGLTKAIGVSNFNIEQLKQTLEVLPADQLLTNQIEVHPYLQNHKVRKFCEQHDILVTAYMPFAVGKVLSDEIIINISEKHNVTPAEVIIAWVKQLDMVTIPSSTKEKNMVVNLKGLALTLDAEDLAKIAELDCNERIAAPDFSPNWD